ncbi:MAG: DUF5009 domain-containing protein [Phycisphaerales bacterium]|nr:DUF5009 domain-containing protein [Phycisphaerales bacterium]
MSTASEAVGSSAGTAADTPAPPRARLLSLDAFRGFDIVLMFVVNLSAASAAFPKWFQHAGWNNGKHGLWLADLVFPWFLFIVGAAVPWSMTSGRGKGQTTAQRIGAAAKRALTIYALGILIFIAKTAKDGLDGKGAGKPGTAIAFETFLHWDILPLIAMGYLVAVVVWHAPRWVWWVVLFGILAYKHVSMPDLTVTEGLVRGDWMKSRTDLDHATRALGFVGTGITQGLPASACCIAGLIVGEFLRASTFSMVRRGFVLVGLGLVATGLSMLWASAGKMPMSKDFLTSSYVLFSAGSAAALLGSFYLVLDAWKVLRWQGSLITAAAVGGFLLLCIALTVTGGAGANATPSALNATVIALCLVMTVLLIGAVWQRLKDPHAKAEAKFLTIYGSNAIAIYVLAELTWTLVWLHMRVVGPGSWGGQHAFTALRLWLEAGLNGLMAPFADEASVKALAAGLAPWASTAVYVMVYFTVAWVLWRKKIFIKV